MKKQKTVVVGSKDNPIQIYWNIQNKRADDFLMVLSLTSGAYGDEILDEEEFKTNAKAFVRYAKKSDNYYKQLIYVLENSSRECSEFLDDLLKKKWNLSFEYNNVADKWAVA